MNLWQLPLVEQSGTSFYNHSFIIASSLYNRPEGLKVYSQG